MEDHPMPPTILPRRHSLGLSQERAIDGVLINLLTRCPAHYALVADTSGQLLSLSGERGSADPVILAALIAGDMAAGSEITRVIGQYQRSQFSLREGALCNTFIVEAGDELILFVEVAKEVPLGWARMIIAEACQELERIMESPADDADPRGPETKAETVAQWINDALDTVCSRTDDEH